MKHPILMTLLGMGVIITACWLVGNLPAICGMLSVAIIIGVLAANWHGTRA